jgi:3-hydroxyisobutyrate dehydrogenase-like beta-hydroxyacid dehydrogenase
MGPKIAFIGLGHMGTPISTRLLKADYKVAVWDRNPDAAALVVAEGATAATSPAAAATGADFAFTMVTNAEAVEQILFGADGLASVMAPGQVYVDMSTIGPDTFRSIAAKLPDGVHAVDAPVRGSVPEATSGMLHVFVGASDEDFDRLQPILANLGDVRLIGPPGSGQAMKVVVNVTLGVSIVAMGETLALARSLGLDRAAVLDILSESPIGPEVSAKRPNVETGRYPANFMLSLMYKDMGLVEDEAGRAGLDLEQASAVRRVLGKAMDLGAGDMDFSAVVATILGEEPRG